MNKIVQELENMVKLEREKLLAYAKRLVPHITPEDLLQPQDFADLEQDPEFRYLEGVCIGLEGALAAAYAQAALSGSPKNSLAE